MLSRYHSRRVSLGVLAAVLCLRATIANEPDNERILLSNTRQLIFEGLRSGEGYFNRDGSLLVFMSEREPGNPFFQIYLMNMETGETQRLSPGSGRSTCAWIHPSNQKVLFSSTHLDPAARQKQQKEYELRKAGKDRSYGWDYDEYMNEGTMPRVATLRTAVPSSSLQIAKDIRLGSRKGTRTFSRKIRPT